MEPVEESYALTYQAETRRMLLVVKGFATGEKSKEACARFIELLGKKNVDFVADLDEVTGYESDARQVWQECLRSVRSQIGYILVVGRNIPSMVRMAATVVAAFTGVPIRFFSTYAELDAGDVGRRRRG